MVDKNSIEQNDIELELKQQIMGNYKKQRNVETLVFAILIVLLFVFGYSPAKDIVKNIGLEMFFVWLVLILVVIAMFLSPILFFLNKDMFTFKDEALIQAEKQFQTNEISLDENILWQEDGSYPEKQEKYSSESMSPKEQIIALVFILPFIPGVTWLCLLEIYQQWIIWLAYSIAGVICLIILFVIFYLLKNEVKKQIPNLKIGHIAYSYVITDKAVYSKIGKVDKLFEKFYFEQIDEIYLYDTNTICLATRKGDEHDIELKNVKDFDMVVNLLKEKTGIEPKYY